VVASDDLALADLKNHAAGIALFNGDGDDIPVKQGRIDYFLALVKVLDGEELIAQTCRLFKSAFRCGGLHLTGHGFDDGSTFTFDESHDEIDGFLVFFTRNMTLTGAMALFDVIVEANTEFALPDALFGQGKIACADGKKLFDGLEQLPH